MSNLDQFHQALIEARCNSVKISLFTFTLCACIELLFALCFIRDSIDSRPVFLSKIFLRNSYIELLKTQREKMGTGVWLVLKLRVYIHICKNYIKYIYYIYNLYIYNYIILLFYIYNLYNTYNNV